VTLSDDGECIHFDPAYFKPYSLQTIRRNPVGPESWVRPLEDRGLHVEEVEKDSYSDLEDFPDTIDRIDTDVYLSRASRAFCHLDDLLYIHRKGLEPDKCLENFSSFAEG
jgi:hypothetical protein